MFELKVGDPLCSTLYADVILLDENIGCIYLEYDDTIQYNSDGSIKSVFLDGWEWRVFNISHFIPFFKKNNSETQDFLGPKKYVPRLHDIYDGLGIPWGISEKDNA